MFFDKQTIYENVLFNIFCTQSEAIKVQRTSAYNCQFVLTISCSFTSIDDNHGACVYSKILWSIDAIESKHSNLVFCFLSL